MKHFHQRTETFDGGMLIGWFKSTVNGEKKMEGGILFIPTSRHTQTRNNKTTKHVFLKICVGRILPSLAVSFSLLRFTHPSLLPH